MLVLKIIICISIDPRPLNYPLLTLDDVFLELSKAKVITTVDLTSGYWHIKLDDKSSYLTVFNTPQGSYRCVWHLVWTFLTFLIKLNNSVHDLKGVITVAGCNLKINRWWSFNYCEESNYSRTCNTWWNSVSWWKSSHTP